MAGSEVVEASVAEASVVEAGAAEAGMAEVVGSVVSQALMMMTMMISACRAHRGAVVLPPEASAVGRPARLVAGSEVP